MVSLVTNDGVTSVDADIVVEWPFCRSASTSTFRCYRIKVRYQSHHGDPPPRRCQCRAPPCRPPHQPPPPPLVCGRGPRECCCCPPQPLHLHPRGAHVHLGHPRCPHHGPPPPLPHRRPVCCRNPLQPPLHRSVKEASHRRPRGPPRRAD